MVKSLTSYRFAWFIFTGVYILLTVSGGFGKITGFVGLFVPVGPFSLVSIAGYLSSIGTESADSVFEFFIPAVLVLSLLVLSLFYTDRISDKFGLENKKFLKIIFNLSALFILTIIVDLLLYRSWLSLEIFRNGGSLPF